ncbi:MAG: helix-turn-helix domain-containing protein [Lachnospiraceae bacterium]|nr:helix-turn-helix domain-containing protein [Lachnospiraceae bacterium]
MAVKYVGDLVKEARTGAKLTQDALAKKVKGTSGADIGKIERNELKPSQDQLKAIAKATGVTQKSLLDAPVKAKASSAASSKKTSSAKTSSTAKKTTSSTGSSVKVTAAEKKVLELYRKADADTKKAALALLKGEKSDVTSLIESVLSNKKVMSTVTGLFK